MKNYRALSFVARLGARLGAFTFVLFIVARPLGAQISKSSSGGANPPANETQARLEFQISIRNAGFMGWTEGGMMSGMLDRGFAIDALQARLSGAGSGGVWYSVCTDDGVWQSWLKNGEVAGAQNQKNIQAIALTLFDVPRTDIAYRVHLTGGDWLPWVKNGAVAGLIGKNTTIDAVEIRLEPGRGSVSTVTAFEPPKMFTTSTLGQTAPAASTSSNANSTQSNAAQALESSNAGIAKTSAGAQTGGQVQTFTVNEPPPAINKQSANQPLNNAQQQNQQQNQQQDARQNSGLQQFGQGVGQGIAQGLSNQGGTQNQMGNQWNNPQGNQWNNQQGNWNNPQGNQFGAMNQPTGQTWSQWTNQPMRNMRDGANASPVFVPISSRRVALAANNGRFLTVANDPRDGVVFSAIRPTIGETEIFELAFVGEHRVAFRAGNGRYLGVHRTQENAPPRLAPLNDIIGQNEIFEMLSAPQDRVSFRAANGQVLSVESFGQSRLFVKDGFIGPWESFTVVLPDGTPLLNESPSNNLWRSQNDGSRVVFVDQQGRPVESSDRVLMLIANAPPAVATSATVAATPAPPAEPAKSVVPPSSYLTPMEIEILNELNFVRTKPNEYATLLERHRSFYKGTTYTAPGQRPLKTKEGVKALDELIMALKLARPAVELTPIKALSDAARDHIKDTGPKGRVGHVGSDRSNPNERAGRYGKGIVNENLCYNRTSAREIVVRMLVDDGTADRGYRKNILNPAHKLVGIGFGTHKTQQALCVQVFAADFIEK
jgi:uncharacterized protein YkwD